MWFLNLPTITSLVPKPEALIRLGRNVKQASVVLDEGRHILNVQFSNELAAAKNELCATLGMALGSVQVSKQTTSALEGWAAPATTQFWMIAAKLLKLWCGEGDLNPHEIAPASTSS